MRKTTSILLSATLLFGVAGLGCADAAKRQPAAKKNTATTSSAGYPHFYLQEYVIKNVVTPKTLSLNGPVKTVRSITPVYPGQYEDQEGAISNYTFDTDGKPLSICHDNFGDAAGWGRFYMTYDDNGNFESIKVDVMEGTQDGCRDDQSVKATYTFDYDGDKITRITEQTTSVWGKPVNWKPFHYTVTYTSAGRIKKITCEEDPRVYINFDNDQLSGKRFVNEMKYNERTNKCSSGWRLDTIYNYYSDNDSEEIRSKATINHRDDNNNWTDRSWYGEDEYGERGKFGEFREITYYE